MAAPGLMDSTALTPPGQTPPPQAAPQPSGDDSGDDDGLSEQATPQQHAQLAQFVAQCKMLIYGRQNQKTTTSIIQMLKTGSPVQALAQAAAMVVDRVEMAANQAGDQLDPAVLLQGGKMLIDDLADFSSQVSKAQGTPVYTDQQKSQAFLLAADIYRRSKQKAGQPVGGLTQPAAQQLFGQYKQASQQGNLDSVLPGASEAAQMAPNLGKQAQAPAQGAPAPGLTPSAPPKKKKKRRR